MGLTVKGVCKNGVAHMKYLYEACEKAKIEVPEEILEFFDFSAPPKGEEVEFHLDLHPSVDMFKNGFEVELSKLPKNVTHIRIFKDDEE